MAQNDGSAKHACVLNCVTIQDTIIQDAMDSCIAILYECQFFKDSIESVVIVSPIDVKNEYVTRMVFLITPKSWSDLECTMEFYKSLKMPQPKFAKYRGIDFVFFLPDTREQFAEEKCHDTSYFSEPKWYYRYYKGDRIPDDLDIKIFSSKCTEMVEGYVYLSQHDNGEWGIKAIRCMDVSHSKVLLEDGKKRIYLIP